MFNFKTKELRCCFCHQLFGKTDWFFGEIQIKCRRCKKICSIGQHSKCIFLRELQFGVKKTSLRQECGFVWRAAQNCSLCSDQPSCLLGSFVRQNFLENK
ncbi:MAG: hypothetical protein COU31_04610 [Candidatus Magasanikbacteria bacterium CG10_big_fil_rev_8_21_14_0_10_40_10]|uniref:Uncharacterized protein n=1 Tax=Candidatus Magasanikbacteria bacterium CG10_big_fil_rev_8_21_14_0_10_40_10 TaxID=1974648 RepID=A0A2M6W336_9BACT|nr:MAG: hypothetical protein COU31_04610 [Candidatus Magasanikbacteria bacterium CG10_big_fil_rev_8_21_14_0_10_40_10]